MPYDVPVEHMDQAIEAKDWYEQYYAKYPESW
jgi:hypothetical protein